VQVRDGIVGDEPVTEEMPVPKREVGIDSLRERMAGRTEEVQRQYTKVWPIPGWEDKVAVELRMLSYRETRMIYKIAEREKDEITGELYGIADQIIRATEGFHLVGEDGETEPIAGATWMDVARSMPGANLPEDLTPRQALFAVISDRTLALFFAEWEGWQRRGGRDVGEEVMRDFERTP
jgi:hypothetical protein